MSLITSLSFKAIAGVGSAVVVVGGGTAIGYAAMPSSHKSDQMGRDINDPKEVAKKRKLKVDEVGDTSSYVYVLASVAAIGQTADNLYTSKNKNFQCIITGESEIISNNVCDIYQINDNNDTSTISISDHEEKVLIKDKKNLTINKHVIVKLATTFKERLSKEKPNFQFASSSDVTAAILELKWEFDLNRNQTKKEKPISESSLMVIKLTEAPDFSHANSADNSYSCFLGTEATGIDCKVYVATNPEGQYTRETLKTIGAITTGTNAAQGNFLIVELKTSTKSFHELDNKHIVIKNTNSQQIAKGILDNLLIGVIDENATSSLLFKLKNVEGRTTIGKWDSKNHIITKYVDQHMALNETFEHANVVCRFIENQEIYQDETCTVYQFGGDSFSNFDQQRFANQTNRATGYSHLTTDKYQVVKVDQEIIDKLTASSNKRLEIIPSSKRKRGFDNSFIGLEMKQVLTSGEPGKQMLHSKLFVAKVKEQKSDAQNDSNAAEATFTCSINGTDVGCNVYKFTADVAHATITKEAFSSIQNSITPKTDLANDKYVVIELTDSTKTFLDLVAQPITLKNSSGTEYATLNFDQQIFGYIDGSTKYGLPIAKNPVSFIVSKIPGTHDDWSTENISENAVCKYRNEHGVESFDNTCKLIKIPAPENNKKLVALSTIHSLNSETKGAWNLKNDDDGLYKLIFDANMLSGLNLNNFDNQTITLELPATSSKKAVTYGTVKLEQKIEGPNTFKGKIKMLLAKYVSVTENINSDGSLCEYQRYDSFKCALYKNTDTSTDKNKSIDNVSFAGAMDLSETLVANGYYLIKNGNPNENNLSNTETVFYMNQEKNGVITRQMFMIKKIVVGNPEGGKLLCDLKTLSR